MSGIGFEILQLFKDPAAAKVFELFTRLIGNMTPSMLKTVAKRFDQLLESHQLNGAELLSLVPPEWGCNLSTVDDPLQLSKALKAECFPWFASTFQVNESWLNGSEEQAVTPFCGYKQLGRLGTTLKQEGWISKELGMTILAEDYDGQDESLGRYAIVFSTPIAELGDRKTIYKLALFETAWNWDYLPCRIETKAIARWYSMILHQYGLIPIVSINRKQFQQIIENEILPAKFVNLEIGGYDHFEDRVMNPDESQKAVETEETEAVIEHLQKSGFLNSVQTDVKKK